METNILEARDDKGWAKVPAYAPAFVKVFITEFRTAALADRPMSKQYLASYTSGAETRSLGSRAMDFGRRLFRSNPDRSTEQLDFKKRFVEKHFPRMTADEIRAHRIKRLGETIQNDEATLQATEAMESSIRDMRRECFPWEGESH
jgi:hypothetical protein